MAIEFRAMSCFQVVAHSDCYVVGTHVDMMLNIILQVSLLIFKGDHERLPAMGKHLLT